MDLWHDSYKHTFVSGRLTILGGWRYDGRIIKSKHSSVLSSFMTYHRVSKHSNTTVCPSSSGHCVVCPSSGHSVVSPSFLLNIVLSVLLLLDIVLSVLLLLDIVLSVLPLLDIVLSVLLRITNSDYLFGISKHSSEWHQSFTIENVEGVIY